MILNGIVIAYTAVWRYNHKKRSILRFCEKSMGAVITAPIDFFDDGSIGLSQHPRMFQRTDDKREKERTL